MINSGSLCVCVWQASRDISLNTIGTRNYRSSWCHQSSACDLLQMWLWKSVKETLESCRQQPYVTNSCIIYWNQPYFFFSPPSSTQVSHWPVSLTKEWHHPLGAVTQTADILSHSKELESGYKQEEPVIVHIGFNGFLHEHRLYWIGDMAQMPNRV